ncbi:MAG TPA: peptide-methionine (S)-S-oxide reductase, partial [Methylophilus sp.]
NRQGNDVGTQYRSAIFYTDEAQRESALQIIQEFDERHIYDAPIVTEVVPATTFYPAEDYHQYYFAKNPSQPYCLAVAAPKAAKIRQKYAQLIKPSIV